MAWHKNCRVREHNAAFPTLKPSRVSFLIARRGIERDLAPHSAPFLARSARPAESERTLGVRVCCEVRVTADALWAVGAMLPFAVVCSLSSFCASFRGTCSAFPPFRGPPPSRDVPRWLPGTNAKRVRRPLRVAGFLWS